MTSYLEQLFALKGKVAAITGGGGHLCGEMARGLVRAGCSVVLLDIRPDKCLAIQSELNRDGFHDILTHPLDVSVKSDHQRALDFVLDNYGKIDIFINGAGINAPTPFLEIDLDEWYRVLDSQITGTMLGCQVFGSQMLDQSNGSIINISSASAGPPLSKAFTYSVAKAGIVNLTQNLAREWASRGVRVNSIRPGFFPTAWNIKNFITKERESAILGHTPMQRYGAPSELVGATLWLASDASSFVTGSDVTVDGGFSCMTV